MVLLGVALLLSGGAVNIAVAWACVMWSPVRIRTEDAFVDWPRKPPDDYLPENGVYLTASRSWGVVESDATGCGPAWRYDVGMQHWLRAGWPWPALERVVERRRGGDIEDTVAGVPTRGWREGLWLGRVAERLGAQRAALPLAPVWAGMAANTAVFGGLALVALVVRAEVRRAGGVGRFAMGRRRAGAVLALVAAGLSVAVAIAGGVLGGVRYQYLDEGNYAWPIAVDGWPAEGGGFRHEGPLVIERHYRNHRTIAVSVDGEEDEVVCYGQSVRASGWPCVALVSAWASTSRSVRSSNWQGRQQPVNCGFWWGGVPIRLDAARGPIPLRPLWRGLGINALVYWVCLCIAGTFCLGARAALRGDRGGCAACGYDLAGLPPERPCPECGAFASTGAAAG